MNAYRNMVRLIALVMVALGAGMLVITIVRGGGVGILLGLLFVAAGGGRLYMARGRGT